MYHTENDTTVQVGHAVATVIAASVSPRGERITTLELVYPRVIHSELMTHRQFSRNASSSRATPVKTMLAEVRDNPFVPDTWRYARKGMTAGARMVPKDELKCLNAYMRVMNDTLDAASTMAEAGAAKEHVNRILEPYSYIRTLVTSTAWENFFRLRLSEHAQPEMQELAKAMKKSMEQAVPQLRKWHTPYVDMSSVSLELGIVDCLKVSVARCARVSYMTHEGREPDASRDLALADRLLKDWHMSPFEHVAHVAPDDRPCCANFRGWRSLRHRIETEGESWCRNL